MRKITKKEKDKVLIGIPVYNEDKVILNFLQKLKTEKFEEKVDILILDDGSTDKTFTQAKKANVKVLKHVLNRGAGAARKTILKYAKLKNYNFLVYMDGDGQHSIKDLKNLLSEKNEADLIIGKRKLKNKNMPLSKKIVNFLGRYVMFFLSKRFICDSQSGFKILNKKAMNLIKLTFDGYENDSEFVFEAVKHNLKIKEIPIKVIYTKHSLAKKHGQRWWKGFKMIGRFIFKK